MYVPPPGWPPIASEKHLSLADPLRTKHGIRHRERIIRQRELHPNPQRLANLKGLGKVTAAPRVIHEATPVV
jgi:hypothetical protein